MNETLEYLAERFPHDTLPIELPSLWDAVELENSGLARETFDGAWTITAEGLIAAGRVDETRDTIPSPPPVPREETAGRRLAACMERDEEALTWIEGTSDHECLAAIAHVVDWKSVRRAVDFAEYCGVDSAGIHLLDVACEIAEKRA